MRKSAIVSLVFAALLVLCGFGLMVSSFAACGYGYGYGMGLDVLIASQFGMMKMVFGSSFFIGGILLLCLSTFLFSRGGKEKVVVQAKEEKKAAIEGPKKEETVKEDVK
ncbi:MAG: hypothetical protein WCR02_07605 [Sphaerochaetaceae bacterium]